jgi:hypothetical protein
VPWSEKCLKKQFHGTPLGNRFSVVEYIGLYSVSPKKYPLYRNYPIVIRVLFWGTHCRSSITRKVPKKNILKTFKSAKLNQHMKNYVEK